MDLTFGYPYWLVKHGVPATYGKTKDGLADIGETPEMPNAYFALGYGRNGITYSLIAAELIRNAYCGRPHSDSRLFRFDR